MKKVILLGALLASSFTFGQNIDWSTIPEDKVSETILQQENQMSAWVDYTEYFKAKKIVDDRIAQQRAIELKTVRKKSEVKKVREKAAKRANEFSNYTLEMNSRTVMGSDVYVMKIYRSKNKWPQGYRYVTISTINGKEDSRTITYQQF